MGAANALPSVTHSDNDVQVRVAQFQSGGISQSAAMQTMQCMRIEKSIKKSRAADITDHGDLMTGQAHVLKCLVEGLGDTLMGASRTKYRGSRGVEQTIHW